MQEQQRLALAVDLVVVVHAVDLDVAGLLWGRRSVASFVVVPSSAWTVIGATKAAAATATPAIMILFDHGLTPIANLERQANRKI